MSFDLDDEEWGYGPGRGTEKRTIKTCASSKRLRHRKQNKGGSRCDTTGPCRQVVGARVVVAQHLSVGLKDRPTSGMEAVLKIHGGGSLRAFFLFFVERWFLAEFRNRRLRSLIPLESPVGDRWRWGDSYHIRGSWLSSAIVACGFSSHWNLRLGIGGGGGIVIIYEAPG